MATARDRAPSANLTRRRRSDRAVDELVGICRGVLADGHVNEVEARFLRDWIERNAALASTWPFEPLYARLATILADDFIDADESADLHDTLARFVGGEIYDEKAEVASLSTTLPLTDPPPAIVFPERNFVVTGTFGYGSRKEVAAAILQRGGELASAVSKKVHYLVIGELGSRDWMHSNAGRKIEHAVELRSLGAPLAIVSESHWGSSL